MTITEAFALARLNDVTPSGLQVLLNIIKDAPTTPSRISKEIKTSCASVTGACDRLARDEWIIRTPNPSDRRSWLIMPTPNACETFAHILTNQ